MIGRVGRTKHNKKNIFYDPTFGVPPLGIYGKHPGHDFELLWEWKSKDGCAPMSQMVFLADVLTALSRLSLSPGTIEGTIEVAGRLPLFVSCSIDARQGRLLAFFRLERTLIGPVGPRSV
jgi:hypothetical protein